MSEESKCREILREVCGSLGEHMEIDAKYEISETSTRYGVRTITASIVRTSFVDGERITEVIVSYRAGNWAKLLCKLAIVHWTLELFGIAAPMDIDLNPFVD